MLWLDVGGLALQFMACVVGFPVLSQASWLRRYRKARSWTNPLISIGLKSTAFLVWPVSILFSALFAVSRVRRAFPIMAQWPLRSGLLALWPEVFFLFALSSIVERAALPDPDRMRVNASVGLLPAGHGWLQSSSAWLAGLMMMQLAMVAVIPYCCFWIMATAAPLVLMIAWVPCRNSSCRGLASLIFIFILCRATFIIAWWINVRLIEYIPLVILCILNLSVGLVLLLQEYARDDPAHRRWIGSLAMGLFLIGSALELVAHVYRMLLA